MNYIQTFWQWHIWIFCVWKSITHLIQSEMSTWIRANDIADETRWVRMYPELGERAKAFQTETEQSSTTVSEDAGFFSRLFIMWRWHACIILTISPATQHAPNLGVMVAIFAVYVDTQIVNIGVEKTSQLADSHVVLKWRMVGNVWIGWKYLAAVIFWYRFKTCDVFRIIVQCIRNQYILQTSQRLQNISSSLAFVISEFSFLSPLLL